MPKLLKLLSILLVVSLGVVGCAGHVKQAAGPADPVAPVYSMVEVSAMAGEFTLALVNPEAEDEGKAHSYCTAVWVGPREILTASHCVVGVTRHLEQQDPEDAPARDPFDTQYRFVTEKENQGVNHEPSALHLAKLVKLDRDHDLALLKAVGNAVPSHKYAQLADEVPALGEHVVMVGHPRGIYWTHVEGVVSQVHKDLPTPKKGPFVQINGTVFFGNSGGGAFDCHGHLIGVASFLPPVPNMGVYIHRDSIAKFLGL